MSEAIIRDYLAYNLEFLEPGMRLIDDEYHLRNPNGADGFLDIFAQDQEGNLIIIEVKKTNSTARQAITEISKYASLLKTHKGLKNSEFRLIIVSAAWHELLTPYSEFVHATNYRISAYEITLGANGIPIKKETIAPLPPVLTRNICRRHFIWEFLTKAKMERAREVLIDHLNQIGIEDYILGIAELKPHPDKIQYMLYFAQQLKTKDFYCNIIRKRYSPEYAEGLLNWIELQDKEEQTNEAADNAVDSSGIKSDGTQISYPERFREWNATGWRQLTIERFGIFKRDERLTDQQIIEDLKGNSGASISHFFAAFNMNNRARLAEVREEYKKCLFYNDEWRHKISDIFDYLVLKQATVVTLHIYNTNDILETIWATAHASLEHYTPKFMLVAEFDERTEVFIGKVGWNGKQCSLKELLNDFYKGSFGEYFLQRHFKGIWTKNMDIMQSMGLMYMVDHISIDDDSIETYSSNVMVRGSKVTGILEKCEKNFYDFMNADLQVKHEILEMFDAHQVAPSMFSFRDKTNF